MKIYNKYYLLFGVVTLIDIAVIIFYRPFFAKYSWYMVAFSVVLFVYIFFIVGKKAAR